MKNKNLFFMYSIYSMLRIIHLSLEIMDTLLNSDFDKSGFFQVSNIILLIIVFCEMMKNWKIFRN